MMMSVRLHAKRIELEPGFEQKGYYGVHGSAKSQLTYTIVWALDIETLSLFGYHVRVVVRG